MKTSLLVILTLLVSSFSFSQGTETFTNIGTSITPAYQTRAWTGDNGIAWAATDARIDNVSITGQAVGIRAGKISAATINNGIGNLTFKYKYLFTGAEAILNIKVNGTVVGTLNVPPTATAAQTATFNNLNVAGTFSLEIGETIATPPAGQTSVPRVVIDDVSWTAYVGTPCVTPGSQPINLVFNTVTPTSINGEFTNLDQGIDGFLVIRSTSNTLTENPVNSTIYSEGDVVGNGTVVSSGADESFSATELTQATTYYFFVFSMNSVCSGGPLYLTTTPLTGSAATTSPPLCAAPANAPGAITFLPSNTSVSGSFQPSASADGYVVVTNTTGVLDFAPANGITYAAGQTVGTTNTGTVVSYSSATTFSLTGLSPTTTYYLYVFAANNYYCTGGPLYFGTSSNAQVTTTATPTTGEPVGYYTNAANKGCAELKTALKTIITNGMTPKSYNALWAQYTISDIKPREVGSGSPNVIWDIYSDKPNGPDPYNFTPGTNQCGNYSGEGQCYNREHSFPQSWFTGGTNTGPGTDYHHIFPTDGQVNALRGSYVFGEVANYTDTSRNRSELGPSSFAGVAGTVFEPIDEYKGDVARAFLYMVTRYEDNMPAWGNLSSNSAPALEANTYPSIDSPYLRMMIKWHNQDPVSTKEINRNNGAYSYQHNRNPFVDHPEFVSLIWNNTCPGSGLSTLPVDIVLFQGKLVAAKVHLSWVAENELNFDRFEVERSLNGTSYQKIGSVKAANLLNYSYNDDVDALRGQRVYYRLKKVDKDGNFKYSLVFTLHIPNNTKFSVYPNPASTYIQLQMNQNVNGKVTIQVTDALGKVLQQQNLTVNASNVRLSTATLSSGTYLIKMIYKGEQYIQKVVVAK